MSISRDKPLPYSTLLLWVKAIGVITGFRQVARPYRLRYGAAKALDNSGSVSDSLRNLIMHHADTRTFLKYYLDRRIDKNLPALIRGLSPDEDIMHAACWMSRTIDPNRPQDLTTVQSSSVNQRPETLALVQRHDELRQQLGRPLSRHRGTVKYDAYRYGIKKSAARENGPEMRCCRSFRKNMTKNNLCWKFNDSCPRLRLSKLSKQNCNSRKSFLYLKASYRMPTRT